jgi:serine/threonine protein kinase
MSFNVGENIGPYRIVEKLGQGGMATVYKAYHASLDRYVALKALHPAFNEDKSFAARFQREARVVARLEHPHIVPVHDYAEHEGRPYLVMKFIEGDTLKARLDQGPLSSDEIADMVDAVGSALAHAHKQGILHRDIKPSNVLLATDGKIYLADFGLARIAQSGESTLSSDMIMGTPQYISPEQAMGKGDLDQRTDLYSFGVMLYEMVVGRVPFNADTPFSIIHDHIYTPLPLPHIVNPNVPEPVERVLLKALAKEREDRFEDALQLVTAFKGAWNEAGMPMQGTFVRVSQSMKPVEKAAPPVSAATKIAAPAPVQLPANPPEAESAIEAKKKRFPLMWVGVGVVILLCLGMIGFARSNRLFARFLTNSRTSATATLVATAQPEPSIVPLQNTPLPQPTGGGPIPPPEVVDAQNRAHDNPNDLNAQLDLALALWNANLPRQTYETIGGLIKLAGPDNRDFFVQAGDKFKSQKEGWLPAASLYFQAMRSYAVAGNIPDHLTESFHESAYKAADRPEVPLMVPFDKVAEVDQAISLIAKSRNAFFTGRVDEAHALLNQVKRLESTMREAFLLEGEFSALEGQKDRARLVLSPLVSDTASTPEWIRLFAQQILDGIR